MNRLRWNRPLPFMTDSKRQAPCATCRASRLPRSDLPCRRQFPAALGAKSPHSALQPVKPIDLLIGFLIKTKSSCRAEDQFGISRAWTAATGKPGIAGYATGGRDLRARHVNADRQQCRVSLISRDELRRPFNNAVQSPD